MGAAKPLIKPSTDLGANQCAGKALGIEMGAPWHLNREKFEREGVFACSSNYTLHGNLSKRVVMMLATFAAELEIYSIYEAFLASREYKTSHVVGQIGTDDILPLHCRLQRPEIHCIPLNNPHRAGCISTVEAA